VEPTRGTRPLVDPRRPVPLSASAVDAVTECPLKWLLVRRLGAGRGRSVASAFGSAVHAGAAALVAGTDLAGVVEEMRPMWGDLGFSTSWEGVAQWERAQRDLDRFLRWLSALPSGRREAEVPFSLRLDAGGTPVALRGNIDLLHATEPDRVRVVDIKTAADPASKAKAADSTQLGTYQLALAMDALPEWTGSAPDGGLLLYVDAERRGLPAEREQPALDDPRWLLDRIGAAAAIVATETIGPRPGDACRLCEAADACPAQGWAPWLDGRGL
jgi:RecB family exonuclease